MLLDEEHKGCLIFYIIAAIVVVAICSLGSVAGDIFGGNAETITVVGIFGAIVLLLLLITRWFKKQDDNN